MIGRARRAGWARAVGACGALLVFGCADHPALAGPDNAGPNAWFARCASDPDCRAPGACVNAVCTLACDATSLELCTGLNDDAVCDTDVEACELPCAVDMTCQALGPGFVCAQDRCRAAEPNVAGGDAR
jgi:hypothetical protein